MWVVFLGVVGTHSAFLALMPLARGLSPHGETRVELRARFYAPLGLFSCWRFFFIIIFGVIIGDFARIPGHCY